MNIILANIITSILLLLVMSIAIHIMAALICGYKRYLKEIKLLRGFKAVDYKASHGTTVHYTFTTNNFQQKAIYTSAFYFSDGYYFLQVYYKNEFKYDIYIKMAEQKYDLSKKEWSREDYTISPMPDLIHMFYYRRVYRMIRKAECVKVKDVDDLFDSVNSIKLKKYRLENIDKLLD